MNLKPAAAMVAKKALPIKKSMKGMKKAGKTDFAKKHWYISHMKNKSLHAIRIELSEGGFWVTDVYSSKAAGTVTTAKQLQSTKPRKTANLVRFIQSKEVIETWGGLALLPACMSDKL